MWCCSVCKRKMSKATHLMNEDSTESHLDIPTREITRRHSDVKLNSQNESQIQGLGHGLAPPRSSDTGRRHSDVSPATLKELEKVSQTLSVHSANEMLFIAKCKKLHSALL